MDRVSGRDVNDLAFWFPLIERAGLPVPETRIVTTDCELVSLLDGQMPVGYEAFLSDLGNAARNIGYPCFLRTGHGSGKHDWADTCYLTDPNRLGWHVTALVEWSHSVDLWGLPTATWALRRLIPTTALFVCRAWGDFPVTREFRVFIRDDEIEAVYPYWPAAAIEGADPDRDDWRDRLALSSQQNGEDAAALGFLAGQACAAVGGGYWSIDFLYDRDGAWWLTDMADGARSHKPEQAAA